MSTRRQGAIILAVCAGVALALIGIGARASYSVQIVILGSALLGLVSGVVGSFAVLREQSLVGDAISHAALPGVCIAYLLAGRELAVLLVGAGIAGWTGSLLVSAITRTTRLRQDAALGIILSAFFAFGVALLSHIQGSSGASQAGLDRFIFGQAAAIVASDVALIAGAGAVILLIVGVGWREFKLITFDIGFARANGFNVRVFDLLLSSLIVAAIVLGLQLAGVILMVGLLIAPAAAARQWTKDLGAMVLLAGAIGAFSGAAGALVSASGENLPTGPLIIVVAFAVVFGSVLFAPGRGAVWAAFQQRANRYRFARANLLHEIYDYALRHNDPSYPVPEGLLIAIHGAAGRSTLRAFAAEGLVMPAQTSAGRAWSLTEAGLKALERPAPAATSILQPSMD